MRHERRLRPEVEGLAVELLDLVGAVAGWALGQ